MPDGLIIIIIVVLYLVFNLIASWFSRDESDVINETNEYIRKAREEAENASNEVAESRLKKQEKEEKEQYCDSLFEKFKDFTADIKKCNSKYLTDDKTFRRIVKTIKLDESNSLTMKPSVVLSISLIFGGIFLAYFLLTILYDTKINDLLEVLAFLVFIIIILTIIFVGFLELQELFIYIKDKENFINDGYYFTEENFLIKEKKIFRIPKSKIKVVFFKREQREGPSTDSGYSYYFYDTMFIITDEQKPIILKTMFGAGNLFKLFEINKIQYKIKELLIED